MHVMAQFITELVTHQRKTGPRGGSKGEGVLGPAPLRSSFRPDAEVSAYFQNISCTCLNYFEMQTKCPRSGIMMKDRA
jgi:hypothetical protein